MKTKKCLRFSKVAWILQDLSNSQPRGFLVLSRLFDCQMLLHMPYESYFLGEVHMRKFCESCIYTVKRHNKNSQGTGWYAVPWSNEYMNQPHSPGSLGIRTILHAPKVTPRLETVASIKFDSIQFKSLMNISPWITKTDTCHTVQLGYTSYKLRLSSSSHCTPSSKSRFQFADWPSEITMTATPAASATAQWSLCHIIKTRDKKKQKGIHGQPAIWIILSLQAKHIQSSPYETCHWWSPVPPSIACDPELWFGLDLWKNEKVQSSNATNITWSDMLPKVFRSGHGLESIEEKLSMNLSWPSTVFITFG